MYNYTYAVTLRRKNKWAFIMIGYSNKVNNGKLFEREVQLGFQSL